MRVQGGNAGKAALCWVSAKSEWWLSPAPCELWARVQGQASQSQKWGSRAACRYLLTTCHGPVTPESRDGGGTREVPPGRWGERDGYFPVRRPWGSRLPQCLQQREAHACPSWALGWGPLRDVWSCPERPGGHWSTPRGPWSWALHYRLGRLAEEGGCWQYFHGTVMEPVKHGVF